MFFMCVGVSLMIRVDKPKEEFRKVTGTISYLENTYLGVRTKNDGRHRFMKIRNSHMVFDLFVGKNKGDFKPKFEQIDNLKLDD